MSAALNLMNSLANSFPVKPKLNLVTYSNGIELQRCMKIILAIALPAFPIHQSDLLVTFPADSLRNMLCLFSVYVYHCCHCNFSKSLIERSWTQGGTSGRFRMELLIRKLSIDSDRCLSRSMELSSNVDGLDTLAIAIWTNSNTSYCLSLYIAQLSHHIYCYYYYYYS